MKRACRARTPVFTTGRYQLVVGELQLEMQSTGLRRELFTSLAGAAPLSDGKLVTQMRVFFLNCVARVKCTHFFFVFGGGGGVVQLS